MSLVRLGDVAAITQGLSVVSGDRVPRPDSIKPGPEGWQVRVASVGDVQDDRLTLESLRVADVGPRARAERHLLQTDDVLVSARSTIVKAALVPPLPWPAVADATLLVVRATDAGLGPYLWWYLTSAFGRRQVYAHMKGSTTLLFVAAGSLAEIELPLPKGAGLNAITSLVEASERAYSTATEAALLRRTVIRDAVIDELHRTAKDEEGDEWR